MIILQPPKQKYHTMKYFLCILFLPVFQILGQTNTSSSQTSDTLVKAIQSDTVIRSGNSKQIDDIIAYAKKFLGTPYKWAGTTPSGFDCSGFISYVFGNFGFSLTHSSVAMAELGTTVKLSELQPGDLMFFKGRDASSTRVGHVAMVVEVAPDAIRFIHSASRGVVIDNFIASKYYVPRFIKAKRLDYGVKKPTANTTKETSAGGVDSN
jgi:cell wall-associated NlpC family hydrolase